MSGLLTLNIGMHGLLEWVKMRKCEITRAKTRNQNAKVVSHFRRC